MTWREKTVVAILLLIARMLCEDASFAAEIKTLATHISVNAPKPSVACPVCGMLDGHHVECPGPTAEEE